MCACAASVPCAQYYYISDGAHVPYGNRPPEEILRLTLAALDGINDLKPSALVVACNTVTANCIEMLRQKFTFPVVGIQPAVKQAANIGGRCLVLATNATVKSKAFLKLVDKFAPEETTVVGCGTLAEYIERNVPNIPDSLPEGLLPDVKTDSVVLGCTHYAFVKKQIEDRYNCPVFDGIEGTAAHFSEIMGITDHYYAQNGDFRPLAEKQLKITFNCKNIEHYAQIMKYLFSIRGFCS
ncbi:MAG: aspartate/glutamate racemase family protein [Clostridia bacterium]|nr:aspartate/glutamate racemase family protein [Clostridia bacterium]